MTTQTTEIAPIVFEKNGNIFANSRDVAAYFGKRHDNVLRAISLLECSEHFNRLNFEEIEYRDEKGRLYPMCDMTKDGFAFLVMGFTGKEAARFKEGYITAFNAMETELKARASLSDKEARSKIAMVREASKIHGKATAAALWRDLGLPMPKDNVPEKENEKRQAKGLMKYVYDFIDECIVFDPKAQVTGKETYKRYQQWSATSSAPHIVNMSFGKFLIRAGIVKRHVSTGSVYMGVRLKPQAQLSDHQ